MGNTLKRFLNTLKVFTRLQNPANCHFGPTSKGMFLFFLLQTLCLGAQGVSLAAKAEAGAGQWRAAVYEHQLVTPASFGCTTRICTREEAIEVIASNLEVLIPKVEEAARLGADLILLPEDGIHGYGFTRETIPGFLEELLEGYSPCQLLEDLVDLPIFWEYFYMFYYAQ